MIFKTKHINVIEITTSEVILYRYLFKKEDIQLISSNVYKTLEETFEQISKKEILLLFVNNNQILTKEETLNFTLSTKNCTNYIEKKFSVSTQNFYYDVTPIKQKIVSSVIRKSDLESTLQIIEKGNLIISQCYFGPNQLATIIDDLKDFFYHTNNWKVQPKEELIFTPINNNNLVKDTDSISIFSLAIATQYLKKINTHFGDFKQLQDHLELATNLYRKNSLYRTVGLGILCFLIITSALYYSFQYSKLVELQQQQALNTNRLNKTNQLVVKIEKQEKLINQINKLSNTNISNFIDQILLLKPNSILLKKIDYQPLFKKINVEKNIEIIKNKIHIKGSGNVHSDIQEWISILESLTQIQSVDILSFNDLKTFSEFKIAINLNEDQINITK